MVNLPKKFNIGDKVFAKVRGYPPWPAKIEKIVDPNTKNARYSVYFYGTGETAMCKVEEVFDYLENKPKYGKILRRKFFNEGIQELEEELGIVSTESTPVKSKELDSTTAQENYSLKNDDTANESATATSSDTESKLVIDEKEPKKGFKRKSTMSSQNNTPDVEVKKKKVGRPSLSDTKKQQQQTPQVETPKQNETSKDIGTDSQDEDASGKEFISRSGRKIKPKRYSDFADTPDVQKTEPIGRTKIKQKFEENENSSIVDSPLPKKKTTLEKTNNTPTLITNKLEPEAHSNSILTRTFSGEFVRIKISLDNDKMWDWSAARDALKLKAQLESGEVLPQQVKEKLEFVTTVKENDKRALNDNSYYDKCKEKWVRVQQQLLLTDQQIRNSILMERANTDDCLEALESILYLPLDPLMLKNNLIIVDTIRRLRHYVGNLDAWNLNEKETINFKKKAEQIQQKAEEIFTRFKTMFTIPKGRSFSEVFHDEVAQYQILTKDFTDEERWSMFIEPSSIETSTSKENKSVESSKKEKLETEKIKIEADVEKSKETEQKSETDKSEHEIDTKSVEKLLDDNINQPSENKDDV